jgi:hypothetical protein
MVRIISVSLAVAALALLGHLSAAAQGASVNTSRWLINHNREWDFYIRVPPDWVKVDMSSAEGRRMTLKYDVDSDKMLMCMVFANDEPRTAQSSQQQINEGLLQAGPVPPQEWEATFRSAGQPLRVQSSTLGRIMNLPVNIYEATASFQATTDTHFDATELRAVLNTPGRNYSPQCEATAEQGAQELYRQWLPTFQAVFASFIVEPPRLVR